RSALRAASRAGHTTRAPSVSSSQTGAGAAPADRVLLRPGRAVPVAPADAPGPAPPVARREGTSNQLAAPSPPEQALEVGREEYAVVGPLVSDAPESQAVLGEGDVADLPGDVADPARREPEPVVGGRLVEQPDGVVAGEDDLFDGELQPRHGYSPCAGSARTNLVARPIQSAD